MARLLRRLNSPPLWAAAAKAADPFATNVPATFLEGEFNLGGLSVYEADDDQWARRVASTLLLCTAGRSEFVGVFLDQDELTRRLKIQVSKKKPGDVLDSEVKKKPVDLLGFSLTAIRDLFAYMLDQYRRGQTLVFTKPSAVQFLAQQVQGEDRLRQVIFSTMRGDKH